MEIEKITLIVNNCEFFKNPIGEIVGQRLTINNQARVLFAEYIA